MQDPNSFEELENFELKEAKKKLKTIFIGDKKLISFYAGINQQINDLLQEEDADSEILLEIGDRIVQYRPLLNELKFIIQEFEQEALSPKYAAKIKQKLEYATSEMILSEAEYILNEIKTLKEDNRYAYIQYKEDLRKQEEVKKQQEELRKKNELERQKREEEDARRKKEEEKRKKDLENSRRKEEEERKIKEQVERERKHRELVEQEEREKNERYIKMAKYIGIALAIGLVIWLLLAIVIPFILEWWWAILIAVALIGYGISKLND